MPANEFEKQVQLKMNELGLEPSEAVWLEVEKRIRPEKKRRIIFWFPLLVLGLGITMGTIILTRNKQTKQIGSTELKKPGTKEPATDPATKIKTTSGNQPTETFADKNNQHTHIKDQPAPDKMIAKVENYPVRKKIETDLDKIPVSNKQSLREPVVMAPEKQAVELSTETPSPQVLKNDPVAKTETIKEVPVKTVDSSVITKKDSALAVQPVVEKEQEKPALPKKINQGKWKWGILVQAGSSGIVESARLFNRLLYADYFSSPSSSTGGPAFSQGVTSPAASFGGGVFMQRSISKSTGIRFNFLYSMLATKMYTGPRVDSSRIVTNSASQGLYVTNFYRPADTSGIQSYKNRYHLAGVSADFSWKITKGKKFSLSWENSLGYYIMVSSNALYFDWNIPGYYKDSRLTKKQQVFLSTGLSAPLSANFIINLFAEYGIGAVLKYGSTPTHFTNFGIRARLFPFHKK
ncbi:MAG TPA: hypothetical protein VLJ68_12850 [Chitinophagaceae bacterium]|nr:hypothetical protein [Chitinophagaceae bacterium]